MRRAVLAMHVCPHKLIVDGNRLPRLEGLGAPLTARAIIGGDASEPAISAASILAKTARDQYMNQMDDAVSRSMPSRATRATRPASTGGGSASMGPAACIGAASRPVLALLRRTRRRRGVGFGSGVGSGHRRGSRSRDLPGALIGPIRPSAPAHRVLARSTASCACRS